MSSKSGRVERWHRVRLAGEDGRVAYIANKVHLPVFLLDLEYYLLRRVVHAGLAKVMGGCGSITGALVREDERAFVNLFQRVLSPIRFALLEVSNRCFELSFVVFERLNLISHRRRFLLQVKRGVLYVEDFESELLSRLCDFEVVACLDGLCHQIPRGAERCQACTQAGNVCHGGSPCFEKAGVRTANSKRGVNPHQFGEGV